MPTNVMFYMKSAYTALNSFSYKIKKALPTLTCPFPVCLCPKLSVVGLKDSISSFNRNKLDPFVFFQICFFFVFLVIYSICLLLSMWRTEVLIVFPSIQHVTPVSTENSELQNRIPPWKSRVPRWCMLDNAFKPPKVVQ